MRKVVLQEILALSALELTCQSQISKLAKNQKNQDKLTPIQGHFLDNAMLSSSSSPQYDFLSSSKKTHQTFRTTTVTK